MFYNLLDSGRIPALREIFKSSLRFQKAETVIPTATFPAQASAVTGVYPSQHEVLSNIWMDRRSSNAVLYDYTNNFQLAAEIFGYFLKSPNSFFSSGKKGGIMDAHLSQKVKTIFEAVSENGLSSVSSFHLASRGSDLWIRPSLFNMLLYFFGERWSKLYRVFDETLASRISQRIQKQGLPHLLFVYFIPSDGSAHWRGLEGQKNYLINVVDPLMNRIKEAAQKAAKGEPVSYILFSDHGNTELPHKGAKYLKADWLADLLRKSSRFQKVSHKKTAGQDAVILLDGGMAGIHLKCLETDNWTDNIKGEEACQTAEKILSCCKKELAGAAFKDSSAGRLKFVKSENPMELDFHRLEEKINREFYHINTPDVLLFSNYKEGYYFYKKPVLTVHGNINEEDLNIPFIMSAEERHSGEYGKPVSITDIAPLAAHMLGVEMKTPSDKIFNIFKNYD